MCVWCYFQNNIEPCEKCNLVYCRDCGETFTDCVTDGDDMWADDVPDVYEKLLALDELHTCPKDTREDSGCCNVCMPTETEGH